MGGQKGRALVKVEDRRQSNAIYDVNMTRHPGPPKMRPSLMTLSAKWLVSSSGAAELRRAK